MLDFIIQSGNWKAYYPKNLWEQGVDTNNLLNKNQTIPKKYFIEKQNTFLFYSAVVHADNKYYPNLMFCWLCIMIYPYNKFRPDPANSQSG